MAKSGQKPVFWEKKLGFSLKQLGFSLKKTKKIQLTCFIFGGLEKLLPRIGGPTPRTQRTSILGVGAPIHASTLGVGMPIRAFLLDKEKNYVSMISSPNTLKF